MKTQRELTIEEHEYLQTKGADLHLAVFTAAGETASFEESEKAATQAVTRWTHEERKRLQASKPNSLIPQPKAAQA
jgi:hypothetical protein